jgi:hypothetical protein
LRVAASGPRRRRTRLALLILLLLRRLRLLRRRRGGGLALASSQRPCHPGRPRIDSGGRAPAGTTPLSKLPTGLCSGRVIELRPAWSPAPASRSCFLRAPRPAQGRRRRRDADPAHARGARRPWLQVSSGASRGPGPGQLRHGPPFFHLTRLDTFATAGALGAEGLPFVLSTIYWPMAELTPRAHVGPLRLLHRALSSAPADVAKNGVRALLAGGTWRTPCSPPRRRGGDERVSFLLSRARCLLPNSRAGGGGPEGAGATSRVEPVVNATEPAPPRPTRAAPAGLPPRFCLAAGRIEPRKNHSPSSRRSRASGAAGGRRRPRAPARRLLRRVRTASGCAPARCSCRRSHARPSSPCSPAPRRTWPAWYETPGLVSLRRRPPAPRGGPRTAAAPASTSARAPPTSIRPIRRRCRGGRAGPGPAQDPSCASGAARVHLGRAGRPDAGGLPRGAGGQEAAA